MEAPALSPEGSASSFQSAREAFEEDPLNSNQVQAPHALSQGEDASLAQWEVCLKEWKKRIDCFDKAYQAANTAYNEGAAPKSFTVRHKKAMQATVQDMLAQHAKAATMVQALRLKLGKDTVSAQEEM